MLEEIKQEVLEANLALVKYNLVIFTWGNVSARIEKNLVVIKPSGVKYEKMTAKDMVVVDLDGNIIEGNYKPSSDTPTHLEIYKAFSNIKGICHTHSNYATSFAQAGLGIECLGTTHADYFYGSIPCTRSLNKEEIERDYEANTGKVIVETFKNLNPLSIPSVLVKQHGVFSWGTSVKEAVHNAVVTEEVAKMNFQTLLLPSLEMNFSQMLSDKHYNRKHGVNSYYGQ